MEEQRLLKKKSKAVGNNTNLIVACTDLAEYYVSQDRFSKAIEEYEAVADIYKKENKLIPYAQAHRGIGEAYMGLLQFPKALKHFKIYLDVAVSEKDVLEHQRALAQTGHLYLTWYLETISSNNKTLLEEAYGYFMKSMKKCDSLSDNFEKQDMLARLFSNLGIVKENLGDFHTALNLHEKCIKICLKYDLYEQLYRGYMAIASSFEKQSMYQETIKNYNLAIEAAKKLSLKKVEYMCAAILGKSDTLIKLADFHGAKQVLRKAYKLKTPNQTERKIIEQHLRVVAAMCYTEDEIITCADPRQLKKLYEKMGDGACDLKNFSIAIEYYKKMLEAAERNGASDKELGECYYSLGETYKDNGQFKEAEMYYEKEYNLCKDRLKDSLNTLSKIADLKELAENSAKDIKAVYERALDNCRKKRNIKEEKRMILRYMNFLRRAGCHIDAFTLEQHLDTLNTEPVQEEEESSSSDNESENSEAKVAIGEDIILSDITDLSEDSDTETIETQSSKRRRQNMVKFKKNLNGEWPLHVACIKGNMKTVQHWIDMDHPINVRDNAGWLPLHEAAVHGHLDIVRILLEHKAAINDRGGAECNGITPLHDAASNGHLEVIELLLDKGASSVAKTDDGNTPLLELRRWYERTTPQLTPERQRLYDSLVKRLAEALEKVGQKDESHTQKRASPAFEYVEESSPSSTDTADDYHQVMQSLRHKNTSSNTGAKTVKKRTPHVTDENDVGDDWLEDDIGPVNSKKRKLDDVEKVWSRSSSMGSPQKGFKLMRNSSFGSDASSPLKPLSIEDVDEDFQQRRKPPDFKKKTQVSLLNAGFSRTSPTNLSIKRTNSFDRSKPKQQKLTSFGHTRTLVEADSTTSPVVELSQNVSDPTLFVDVEIERRLFRVPVLLSQINSMTIRWLAEEAAQRYASKEFMRPTLELETSSGAILADDDILSLLFPMGSTQAEKVVAKVVEWSLPPVVERYRETCINMAVAIDESLCDLLEGVSVDLNLSDRGITSKTLCPLIKALNHQNSLTELNLSANFLNTNAITIFCSIMPSIKSLQSLNLSCTGLHSSHMGLLRNAFSITAFPRLSNLDLSDNSLKNASMNDLAIITSHLSLTKLNISNIGLSAITPNLKLNLDYVRHLDVSNNELEVGDIKRLISWTHCNNLLFLNVSNNKAYGVLKHILEVFQQHSIIALESFNLTRCGVNDCDLFELLRLAPRLCTLNLLYNGDLTSISLRRLLECSSIRTLNLIGCDSVWKYFDASICWDVRFGEGEGDMELKMSGGTKFEQEALVNMIRDKKPHCKVDSSSNYMCIKFVE